MATMALCYIISEIKRDIGRKSQFFIPPGFDLPVRGGGSRRNIVTRFDVEKLVMWLSDGETSFVICLAISTQYRRATDRQTDKHPGTT